MLKKLSSILLAFIILASFSVSVFAAPGDGSGNTTLPAISVGPQQNPTGSAIKGSSSSKSAISSDNSSKSAISSDSSSKSAISNDTFNTSESSIAAKSTTVSKKADFEAVISDVLKDGTAISNEYFNMTITNPEKDKESTYYKSYVLSGNSKYDDVVISIAKFNEETGKYEPMYNTDGESSWEIGVFRLFSKEIILTEGTNKIMMIAYRTSQKAIKENIQFNSFTIKLLPESIIKKVFRKTSEVIDFNSLFGKKGK